MRGSGHWVECTDSFDRERSVGVLAGAGVVFVVPPAGGIARLDQAQSRRLLAALDEVSREEALTQGVRAPTDGQ